MVQFLKSIIHTVRIHNAGQPTYCEQKPKMRPQIIGGRIFLYGNRSSAAAAADFGSAAVRQQQSNSLAAVAALCRIPVPVILGDRMELSCPLFPDICSVCRTGKK